MPSREDCIAQLAQATGRSRKAVEDDLDDILERADSFAHDGLGPDQAYAKARDQKLEELGEEAAKRKREEILNARKDIARHRDYRKSIDNIEKIAAKTGLRRLIPQATRLAIEAKLVGINLPIWKGRNSVDAQYVAMRRQWVGGFARDLDKAGLLKVFASRQIEDKWTDELFEINKRDGGNPGVTKDAHALQIAQMIQKWQKVAMNAINAEGGWVRSYSGYITRTSHDAFAIHAAGPDKWIADTIPKLDLKRTFGTDQGDRVRDALREMWAPMARGDHFDYGKPQDEPLYPNVAAKASAARELHFKSGADWRAYNEQYGVNNATHTVVQALSTGARRVALMKEFGTKPAEAFDKDMSYLKATLQGEGKVEHFNDLKKWDQALRNRFAQIDGSSQRPVSRALANTVSNWMAIQRMAKLGGVALTHFASLPTKSLEARYWGIPFSERYASLFRGLTQGLEGSAKREALDATLVAFENRLGHIMQQYDVADAPAGFLSKWESTFFKLTGVSSVIDNQRGDAEAMFAAHVGGKRGTDWKDIGSKEQRVLQGFGLGEAEWKLLHNVEWTELGDRTYLFPPDALKLSDEHIEAYLKETRGGQLGGVRKGDIARARDELATQIATAYSDRAGFAIPMPSARIRAMMFGKDFEPGTVMNAAKRLVFQFKIWPADMIVRAWGREIYGTVGDGRLDRVAGLVEAAVGALAFGVASNAIREFVRGQDPIHKLQTHPLAVILEGGQRSGFGSIVGDYMLGQFDRHGLSAVDSLVGPTFGQIDILMDLMHAGGRTKEGMLSATAMKQRGADALRLVKDNTPYMNLWATDLAMNTLIWHRLQEWINPGYLARSERTQRDQRGTQFWLSPAKTDNWMTGRGGPSPLTQFGNFASGQR